MRIVDEPFPADGRTRFLEIHAHHDDELVRELVGEGLELARVVERGLRVVDRAGADDDEHAVVGAAQDVVDRTARARDVRMNGLACAQLAHDLHRSEQLAALLDAGVVGSGGRHVQAPFVLITRGGSAYKKTASGLAVS